MKTLFKKKSEGIYCEIIDIKNNNFLLEDGFYCLRDEIVDKEFLINFRLKISKKWFEKKEIATLRKKHVIIEKGKSGYSVAFIAKKGRYGGKENKSRFYFYQEKSPKMEYSFRLQEIKEGTFDYKVVEQKKVDKDTKIKKRKVLSSEEKRINRQKWMLEHPFQGGKFSPR